MLLTVLDLKTINFVISGRTNRLRSYRLRKKKQLFDNLLGLSLTLSKIFCERFPYADFGVSELMKGALRKPSILFMDSFVFILLYVIQSVLFLSLIHH